MSPPTVADARRQVTHLLTAVDQLAASLLPGTGPSSRAPQLSAERRARLDAEARAEKDADSDTLPPYLRQKQGLIAPGESPAPMSLDISELLVDILIAGEVLAEAVAQAAGVERLAAASSRYADPRPYLQHVREHLLGLEQDVVTDVERRCASLLMRAHEALGLITDGQLLAALCPWCEGRTSRSPVGGDRTLRVRTLPGGLPAVICEGGRCEPPEAECGARWRGLPAWPEHEWEWLALRLERAAGAA